MRAYGIGIIVMTALATTSAAPPVPAQEAGTEPRSILGEHPGGIYCMTHAP